MNSSGPARETGWPAASFLSRGMDEPKSIFYLLYHEVMNFSEPFWRKIGTQELSGGSFCPGSGLGKKKGAGFWPTPWDFGDPPGT